MHSEEFEEFLKSHNETFILKADPVPAALGPPASDPTPSSTSDLLMNFDLAPLEMFPGPVLTQLDPDLEDDEEDDMEEDEDEENKENSEKSQTSKKRARLDSETSPEMKRLKHIRQEQRRRAVMKTLFDQLECELPPVARAKRSTKLHTLQRTVDYIRNLKMALSMSSNEMAILKLSQNNPTSGKSNPKRSNSIDLANGKGPVYLSPTSNLFPDRMKMPTPVATPPVSMRTQSEPQKATSTESLPKYSASLESSNYSTKLEHPQVSPIYTNPYATQGKPNPPNFTFPSLQYSSSFPSTQHIFSDINLLLSSSNSLFSSPVTSPPQPMEQFSFPPHGVNSQVKYA